MEHIDLLSVPAQTPLVEEVDGSSQSAARRAATKLSRCSTEKRTLRPIRTGVSSSFQSGMD